MKTDLLSDERRWVALPGWRWMRGMTCALTANIVVDVDPSGRPYIVDDMGEVRGARSGDLVAPDLNDPATRGCLRTLSHEITGADCAEPWYDLTPMLDGVSEPRWAIKHNGSTLFASSYAGALLEACEAFYRRARKNPRGARC